MNVDQQNMLPIGTVLHDSFRVERHLSSGGFGNTYVVTHVHFDEQTALKEFFMKGVTQRNGDATVSVSNAENQEQFASQLEKFKKEALRLRRLQNENIVRVHDLFEANGTAYYVMDLVDGESLSERMKRLNRPLTETEVMALLPQVLHALEGVHNQQMWHLDLKPANIMMNRQGRVVLIDFGASKQMDASQGYTSTSSAMCYTPGYAPPEQIEGSLKRIGPWTDFYALGATIYNLLTRQQPPSSTDVMMEGEDAFHFPASVSSDMRQLIIWMMEARPASRPQSVEEIGQRMGQVEEVKTPEPIKITESVDTVLHAPSVETRLHETVETASKYPIVSLTPEFIEAIQKYKELGTFSEGYASVKRKNKWGYINTKGEEVILCLYGDANRFSEGLAGIRHDGFWALDYYGFINAKGQEIIPRKYDAVGNFSEGLAWVRCHDVWKSIQYGFINIEDQEIVPCKYDGAGDFSEGLAWVVRDSFLSKKYGFINAKGQEAIPFKYSDAGNFSEGLAYVKYEGGYGFINAKGEDIIPFDYEGAGNFSGGLTRVKRNGMWGFINEMGEDVIPSNYYDAGDFSEGLAAVKRKGKWGFINANGVEAIPFKYDEAQHFSEGVALVELRGKYGYVDKYGNDTFSI